MGIKKSVNGLFNKLISRDAASVAQARMEEIKTYAELAYKQKIELITLKLDELKQKRLYLLDAYNEDSTIITKNFDMRGYVSKDISLGVDILNEETVLGIAQKHYEELFGKDV